MIVCAPYALLRGHRGRLVRSRARTDFWGTDIRPARSGAERVRRPNKREQRQPAPAPAGGTLGAQATPAGVWLPPAAAGARQRAEHPPAERTPSFFVVLLPLPREGVGGGPIITERSEASARRRPQPPERSRVAICLQKAAFTNRTPLGLVLFAKAAFCERQDVTCFDLVCSRSDRERGAFPWERHPQTGEAITTYFQFSLDRC